MRQTLGTGMMAPLSMADNFIGNYYAGPSGAAMGAMSAADSISDGLMNLRARQDMTAQQAQAQAEKDRLRMEELNQRQAVAQAINPMQAAESSGMGNRDMTRRMALPDANTQMGVYKLIEDKKAKEQEADYKKKSAFAQAWAAQGGYRADPTGEKFMKKVGYNPFEYGVGDIIATSEEKEANRAWQKQMKDDGYTQAQILAQIAASGRNNAQPKLPSAPGYETFINEMGELQMRPIKDGPADIKAQTLAGKQEATQEQAMRQADMMLDSINTARSQIDDYAVIPNTGWGSYTSAMPGTAFDLAETLGTIKGRIGFNELQQMRQNSPTGGALGQVAVQELEALQKVQGSLQQKQSAAQLKKNLETLETTYLDIIHGAGNWKRGADGKPVVFSGAENAQSKVSGPVAKPQGGAKVRKFDKLGNEVVE